MANTKTSIAENIIAHANQLDLKDRSHWHCYYQHREDTAAVEACTGETLIASKKLLSEMPALLEPLIHEAFIPTAVKSPVRLGMSKFGGAPDLAEGIAWPESQAYTLQDALNTYGTKAFDGSSSGKSALPLTFIAQINIADISPEPPLLPEEGRLLFFMDLGVWFEQEDDSSVRVIWDTTSADALQTAPIPETLKRLDQMAHGQWQESVAGLNLPSDSQFTSNFMPPETPVTLEKHWHAAHYLTADYQISALRKKTEALGAVDLYQESLISIEDHLFHQKKQQSHRDHQILGTPDPEQDDPRYTVFYKKLLGKTFYKHGEVEALRAASKRSKKEWDEYISEEALNYVLLLQLDMASLLQMNTEGTYYFLIHKDDLANQKFEKVVTIYQQT